MVAFNPRRNLVMRYQAILFDLDGTLLPMDLEAFTKLYFVALAK